MIQTANDIFVLHTAHTTYAFRVMESGQLEQDADMIVLVCNTLRKLFCMSDEGYETFLMDLEDYKSKLEEEE